MIVTCPGCSSKYRVRDEAVPQGGAELKCPTCHAVFVAHPPKHTEEEIAGALERITRAKDAAESRLHGLTSEKAELEARLADAERRARDADARRLQVEAQVLVLKTELHDLQVEARADLQPLETELRRLRDENARSQARLTAAADCEVRLLQLAEELEEAQKATGRLATELEVEKQTVLRLEAEVASLSRRAATQGSDRTAALEAEISRLQGELSRSSARPSHGTSQALVGLVSAVGPMLWGLEQAIAYLEPFGTNEAELAAHVRQLQLLQAVLKRLAAEAS